MCNAYLCLVSKYLYKRHRTTPPTRPNARPANSARPSRRHPTNLETPLRPHPTSSHRHHHHRTTDTIAGGLRCP